MSSRLRASAQDERYEHDEKSVSSDHSLDSVPLTNSIAPVTEILQELRAGRMVVLVDEEDRENEGDLVMAAEFVTPEAINFMVTHGRGLVCLTLTEDRCRQLDLPLMSNRNGTAYGTNFTVSIEAAQGVETGISVADRAHTIRMAVATDAKPQDLVQPGHIFPLRAVPGGVLVRAGHTEAGCDLTEMAGLTPAAVICEILKPDGTMARLPDLIEYSREHHLKIGTIADLIQYRSEHESVVQRVAQRPITTPWGPFELTVYRDTVEGHPGRPRWRHGAAQCRSLVRRRVRSSSGVVGARRGSRSAQGGQNGFTYLWHWRPNLARSWCWANASDGTT
jgi:3,4-dihydroxy 2-butanone 4-phosphate synthase/GTP cyclohydrolase II